MPKPLLLGMRIPTSYGVDYTEAFAGVYDSLAKTKNVAYAPFFMEDIAGKSEFFLEDALHPNVVGHEHMARRVAPFLARVLN